MNKKILSIIIFGTHTIFLTFALGGSLAPDAHKLFLLQQTQDSISQQPAEMNFNNKDYKYAGRALIYSGLLPGLGEYYTGHWKRGLAFAGVEVTSWLLWSNYTNKGKDTEKMYEKYVDDHWSFSRWIADYYKWDDNANDFKFLFSKNVGDTTNIYIYENLWEGSHSTEFYYTYYVSGEAPRVRLMSTNTQEFREYYESNFEDITMDETLTSDQKIDLINTIISTDDHFHVIQDGAYYENVGKYNGFFAGWDDNDSLSVYDATGYAVAKSPHKWTYRRLRRDSNDYQKVANYMLSTVMMNHVASMIDAVIATKKWNDKVSANLSARTEFNLNEKYGIGGVHLDLTLGW